MSDAADVGVGAAADGGALYRGKPEVSPSSTPEHPTMIAVKHTTTATRFALIPILLVPTPATSPRAMPHALQFVDGSYHITASRVVVHRYDDLVITRRDG
jgi:hypothetical protein